VQLLGDAPNPPLLEPLPHRVLRDDAMKEDDERMSPVGRRRPRDVTHVVAERLHLLGAPRRLVGQRREGELRFVRSAPCARVTTTDRYSDERERTYHELRSQHGLRR